ncbi:MAG: hypothetical protein FWC47_15975 [Oscillospiraceae bacterium]|nr:hypothetical protein [Oscillospiraceae bacterium]
MKKITKILIVSLIFILSIGLSSCSIKKDAILTIALSNIRKMKNYDLVMDMNYGLSVLGLSVNTSTTSSGTVYSDPMKMKIETKVNILGQEQNIQIYAEQIGDNIVTYTGINNGSWQKSETPLNNVSSVSQYNMKDSASLYLENLNNFTQTGIEKINDRDAYKIEGTINGSTLEKLFASNNYLQGASSLGVNNSTISEMFKNMDDMPIAIWIDKGSLYPVKFNLDLSSVLGSMMNNLGNNLTISNYLGLIDINKFSMIITLSNINKASNFDIPSEAKK